MESERGQLAIEAARQHPDRFAILGNFPLDKPESRALVDTWEDQLEVRMPLSDLADLRKEVRLDTLSIPATLDPRRRKLGFQRRLSSDESGCVGTNLEPESGAPVPSLSPRDTQSASPSRRIQRRTTYREIRAYIFAHHGFSPRTGWIAHVKELNGLTLRPTHNRHAATRADPCPPERRTAIEEAKELRKPRRLSSQAGFPLEP